MRKPFGEVEVFYVDSDSADDSVDRANRAEVRIIQLRPQRPCAALARNAGWNAATSEIVLFLDADTELAPDFVADSIGAFRDPHIAVVFGDRREGNPRASVFTRVLDLDWLQAPGAADFCGGDAVMRRSALQDVNGFDETLIAGEEPELCWRLRSRGWQVVHVDRTMAAHELGITRLSQYWRRAVRTGYGYAEVSERFRYTESPLWRAEVKRNRINGVVILLLIMGSLVLGAMRRSAIPIMVAISIFIALAVRTAVRNRWKGADSVTLFLYGLHSHFQQIPILLGQIKYHWQRWRGVSSELIEYKTSFVVPQAISPTRQK
jgi:cellulose synthase/poly-beta-1,6-N-acetylglucosamine synthase-like glycosyltransferase